MHPHSAQPNPSGNAQRFLGLDDTACQNLSHVSALLVMSFICGLLGAAQFLINGIRRQAARRVKLPSATFLLLLQFIFLIAAVGMSMSMVSDFEDNYTDVLSKYQAAVQSSNSDPNFKVGLDAEYGVSVGYLIASLVLNAAASIVAFFFIAMRGMAVVDWK